MYNLLSGKRSRSETFWFPDKMLKLEHRQAHKSNASARQRQRGSRYPELEIANEGDLYLRSLFVKCHYILSRDSDILVCVLTASDRTLIARHPRKAAEETGTRERATLAFTVMR